MYERMEDVQDPDYYRVLGIERNASQADIKRAHRKLAIRYHPDKNPGKEEQFQEVQTAFEILSDPDKRETYDKLGMEGLKMYELFGDKFFVQLVENVMVAICFFVLFTAVLLIQVLFVCLKLAGDIDWTWLVTAIPLLSVEGIACLMVIFVEFLVADPNAEPAKKDATVSDEDAETEGKRRPLARILFSIMTSMPVWVCSSATAITVLLSIHIDKPNTVPIDTVFIVVLAFETVRFLYSTADACWLQKLSVPLADLPEDSPLRNRRRSRVGTDSTGSSNNDEEDPFEEIEIDLPIKVKAFMWSKTIFFTGLRVAVELCVWLKLNGSLSASWATTLTPGFIYLVVLLFSVCLPLCFVSNDDDDAKTTRQKLSAICCFVTCWMIAGIITLVLVISKYDKGDDLDGLQVISPLLSLACLFFFLPCCAFTCVCVCSTCLGGKEPQSGNLSPLLPPLLLKAPQQYGTDGSM